MSRRGLACPRDAQGFCRIALLGGLCLTSREVAPSSCPEDEREAHEMLFEAAQRRRRELERERISR